MRETMVDRKELREIIYRRMHEEGNGDSWYRIEAGMATKEDVYTYQQYYRSTYNELRKLHKFKANAFWLNMLGGRDNTILKDLGLEVCGDRVIFEEGGRKVLTAYLNEVVIPELEKMGLQGVKVSRRITGNCRSILDFSHAKLVESNKEDTLEND